MQYNQNENMIVIWCSHHVWQCASDFQKIGQGLFYRLQQLGRNVSLLFNKYFNRLVFITHYTRISRCLHPDVSRIGNEFHFTMLLLCAYVDGNVWHTMVRGHIQILQRGRAYPLFLLTVVVNQHFYRSDISKQHEP